MQSIKEYLGANPYPGRGLLLGLTPDSTHAIAAYFIMGRSESSRNRIFVNSGLDLQTQLLNPAQTENADLLSYNALRVYGSHIIVSNGDQTDTIYDALAGGHSFEQALRRRSYEPDAPHYTPRLSGLLTMWEGSCQYKLSLLKNGGHEDCQRFFFEYAKPQPGLGHLIHTYMGDSNPLPSFTGEPVALPTQDDMEAFTLELWTALNEENRVALHVRYMDVESGVIKAAAASRFNS